ncbi:hypothetical protein H112_06407 [Trichophyton rubrum D6]|uniref:Uncharacterized protein n=1 Tax=Trichophyton rubrum CBS 288.86 TaxID=1215330 RepID=A0A022VX57_TRIRU|nr:hypothetical protein H100_06422 [Trichophyton rubrum MR850]EZF39496.1 hypothetical protein H102_06388 [Trichophyton rubrum CBS 100081]EZF50323.1 hypothetical protein H103_06414 [Trichophyton rubrum CBS 288.86]EZF60954.1 hypothetical protein H104_06400 [Trichophyton rubrum CBS 289.86]EZF82282.1 hypothetical protein H110_06411 [Trichophyton rubrum MR1448]EZF92719.1 hypothetical protein H113_06459 [Trichophyton rubrum MR1459]EZG04042.1 hypothetical protein H106_06254 [Trichophyton rubrum CBS 
MRRTQPTPTPTGDTISYDKMKNKPDVDVDDVGAATLELGLYLRAPKKNNRGWASQYLLGTRYILLTRVRSKRAWHGWLPRSERACVQLFPRSWLQVGVDVQARSSKNQILSRPARELLVQSPLRSLTPES